MSSEALLIFGIAFAWMSHTVWQHKGDARQHRDDKSRQEREQTRNNCQKEVHQLHAIDCKPDNSFRKMKDTMEDLQKSRLDLHSNLLIGRWTGQWQDINADEDSFNIMATRAVLAVAAVSASGGNTAKTIALCLIDKPAKCTTQQHAGYYEFNSASCRFYAGEVLKRPLKQAENDDVWRLAA